MQSILIPSRLALAAVLALTFMACNDKKSQTDRPSSNASAPRPNTAKGKVVIAMLPKLINIDYFDACKRGAVKAAEELGVTLIYDGPT
jgi:rhamnose transport system substrate-binding protein/rhamnose transport system permease protein